MKRILTILFLLLGLSVAYSQRCTPEQEPNDSPIEAMTISGSSCVIGNIEDGEQDFYQWTLPEDVVRNRRLQLSLEGTSMTQVTLLKLVLSEDGSQVTGRQDLLTLTTETGERVVSEPLLLSEGSYFLGVVQDGSGRYEVDLSVIEVGLPSNQDSEPNESSKDAREQRSSFALQGNLQDSIDYHRWTLSEEDTQQLWRFTANTQLGQELTVKLFSSSGEAIFNETAELNSIDLANLTLEPDTYTFVLSPASEENSRYIIAMNAQGTKTDGRESEPNQSAKQRNSFDPKAGIVGTLEPGDVDYFSFILSEDGFYDLKTDITSPVRLLLWDEAGLEIVDRFTDTLSLNSIYLPASTYTLQLQQADEAFDYHLQLESSEAPEAGFEVEPNDVLSYATSLSEDLQVRGSMVGRDIDIFSFQVDSPQHFRLQVLAEQLNGITVYDEAGTKLYSQPSDGRRTRIDNLVLLAGEYRVELDGVDSDYAFRALSLGEASLELQKADEGTVPSLEAADPEDITAVLPRPAGVLEREPNDHISRAEPLRAGETRIGVLNYTRDHDVYQFSLQQDQYVGFDLMMPENSDIFMDLTGQSRALMRPDLGFLRSDLWLLAGDYFLTLRASEPSDGYYQLRFDQLDSVKLPKDLEPNNQVTQAVPLTIPSVLEGFVGEYRDDDWFALPLFDDEQNLQVTFLHDMTERNIQAVRLYDVAADTWLEDPEISEDQTAYTLVLPANTEAALRVRGEGVYLMRVELADKPFVQVDKPQLSLALELDQTDVAAYWYQGQTVSGKLTLNNNGSSEETVDLLWHSTDAALKLDNLPTEISLEPNSSQTLDLSLTLASDLRDDVPITLSLGAKDGAFISSIQKQLNPICEAPPINSQPHWAEPEAILGYWNVLSSGFGASVIERAEANSRDPHLLDGRASPATGPNHPQGDTVYFDLTGNEPVTLTGALLHPLARQAVPEQLANFEILVSLDDEDYQSVYQGRLEARRQEQAFVFDTPVQARYAALHFLSVQSGNVSSFASLGEFKLLSPDKPVQAVNLANPELGGYIVLSSHLMSQTHPILTETPEGERGERTTLALGREESSISWVVGFHHNRAAQIASLEWLDHISSEEERRVGSVDILVSLDSPMGPWTPLTTWQLERQPSEGIPDVAPLILDSPVWARFVRFELNDLEPRARYDMPETLRLIEHQAEHGRSALGEWGHYSRNAVYEWQNPVHVDDRALIQDDNDSRERASNLALNNAVSETVTLGKDVDWYKITVPEGDNVLELSFSGVPTMEYIFSLEDAEGQPVVYEVLEESASSVVLQANVSPGDYYLHIEEPSRSVAFLWDNSGSMGPYTPIVYNALERFSQDIQVGREEVSLAVFDNGGPYFVMPEMTGQAQKVLHALSSYDRRHGSSNAEEGLLGTSKMLAERVGTRAVLMTTDAESSGANIAAELWQSLGEVKPRVFTFEISSGGNAVPQDLMQSWADSGNGRYEPIATTGDLEVGFARASCLLRRPKAYTVTASTLAVARRPGTLKISQSDVVTDTPATTQSAVEVILDASGSMYKTLEGRFRYEIAKDVLDDLVANTLPDDIPFALRVFGNREESSCRTDLEVALAPLDRDAVRAVIAGVEPQPFAFTPLATSIQQVANDLANAEGAKTVILITDGEESCDGNVEASIQALKDQGIKVQLNIIGFDFDAEDKERARQQFQAWAELGGGQYYDAASSEELELSLEQAVALPTTYDVLDGEGTLVATGIIGGEAIALDHGVYNIAIDSVIVFENIAIQSETATELEWQP